MGVKGIGFYKTGDRFSYNGKFFHFVEVFKVRIRNNIWSEFVLYYDKDGRYAVSKEYFLNSFKPEIK